MTRKAIGGQGKKEGGPACGNGKHDTQGAIGRSRASGREEGRWAHRRRRHSRPSQIEHEALTASKHSACIPGLALAGANAYWLWSEHWEHWSHMPPLEERTEYPYQNIRTKNFPWGDGDKTLL